MKLNEYLKAAKKFAKPIDPIPPELSFTYYCALKLGG